MTDCPEPGCTRPPDGHALHSRTRGCETVLWTVGPPGAPHPPGDEPPPAPTGLGVALADLPARMGTP